LEFIFQVVYDDMLNYHIVVLCMKGLHKNKLNFLMAN